MKNDPEYATPEEVNDRLNERTSKPRSFFAQAMGHAVAIWPSNRKYQGDPIAYIPLTHDPHVTYQLVLNVESTFNGEIENYNKEDKKFYL